MHKKLPLLVAVSGILLSACGNNVTNSTSKTTDSLSSDSVYAAVETKAPNSAKKSAFAGQTRIAGVKTTTAFESKVLNSDLKSPWGIVSLPDGKFLITEKAGTMKIVSQDGTLSSTLTGIPKVDPQGQGGLLGVTIDPAFDQNRMVYWAFAEPVSGGNLTSLAKGKLSADEKSIENAVVIYRATPAYDGKLHYGGRVVFDKQGNLLLSTGERSDMETRVQAQDPKSGLGKVIRLTTEGKAAAGNPSIDPARPEIYSYGHRNVQGMAIHPVTGDLWEAEFGPRGGDEINLIQAGKNYGWPTITYGIEYSGATIGEGITQKEGLEQPVYYWDPSISPSGITFYTGTNVPEWENNLFVGALSGMHIARLVIENNKVVGEERLLSGENQRFRAITQGNDGALYAVTDQGRLYRIGKK